MGEAARSRVEEIIFGSLDPKKESEMHFRERRYRSRCTKAFETLGVYCSKEIEFARFSGRKVLLASVETMLECYRDSEPSYSFETVEGGKK